jgi:mono/diheme cytochrome c family protein
LGLMRDTMDLNLVRLTALVCGLVGGANAALAQEDLFAEGLALYDQNCALCHETTGMGDPPHFPALAGNPIIADVGRIVANIHEGRGNMPPFPTLEAPEIAAIATYLRGAWENNYPAASPEDVAQILTGLGGATDAVSMWDGVYTEAQAARGAAAYLGPCGLCHGRTANGAPDDPDMRPAPALSRYRFIRVWDGRSLATLYEYTRSTMPQSNPGYMDDQTYVDIIAFLLDRSGAPSGDVELVPDLGTLARIVIEPEQ